ncbi:MAG: hypothetical protein IPN88_15965 [Bacteroidetes bacterium]|nr:hypothetical protein [Bacteroidota bacterium]
MTGFLKLEKAIFYCVLFTPRELLKKNLRKLQFILTTADPLEIVFDNKELIESAIIKIEKIQSIEEKANLYRQIGTWFRQMLKYEDALHLLQEID